MDKGVSSHFELFQGYLDVCNRALEPNRSRFPFKQVLGAAQSAGRGRSVGVRIVEDDLDSKFIIKIERELIKGELHAACPDCTCDGHWRVSRKYMENVVKNPDAYVRNPAKLDWDWMYKKSR